MLSVNPDLTKQEVVDILRSTAHDIGSDGRDNETGYGLVDAHKAVLAAFKADVYMTSPRISETQVSPGQVITFTARQHISNSDYPRVYPDITLYWSTSRSSVEDAIIIGSTSSSIGRGDSYDDESYSFPVPEGTGVRYLVGVCNNNKAVIETNYLNNGVQFTMNVTSNSADIYLDNMGVTDNTVTAGQQISGAVGVYLAPYNGPGIRPVMVWYWSGSPTDISGATYLGQDVSTIGNGDPYDPETITFNVPNGSSSTMYLVAKADVYNVLNDDQSNDLLAVPVFVSGGSLPDVYASSLSVSDVNPTEGQRVRGQARIYMNPGSAPYANVRTKYYWGRYSSSLSGAVYLGEDNSGIGGGDPYDSESIYFNVPNGTGYRYFITLVDVYNVVTESNEQNIFSTRVRVSSSFQSGNNSSSLARSSGETDRDLESKEMKIYPTLLSGSDLLNIELGTTSKEATKGIVVNSSGQEIVAFTIPAGSIKHSLIVPHVPAGMYAVRVLNSGEIRSFKVIFTGQ
jgi:hypothetical protein